MVPLVFIRLSQICRRNAAPTTLLNGVVPLSTVRPISHAAVADHNPEASPHTVIKRVCFWVCDSYYNQQKKSTHSDSTRPLLNLPIDADSLTADQAITVIASLADEAGSMVALSFFHWAIGFAKFKHCMRFYIVAASCLIKNGNFERTHEVLRYMLWNFAEVGMLKESIDMVLELRSHGLVLSSHTLNCALSVVNGMGCFEIAQNVFDEMCERGVIPDAYSFESMVVAYCRAGRVSDADRWLSDMLSRGFLVDKATCSLILNMLCANGRVNRALWVFNKMVEIGLKPNVVHFSCLINGLSSRGSVKQAFELLEEMARRGLKPNVYTHTSLIDGLCKKGWTDKAFRLFLKLVRSDNYKPNVYTYTAMIDGYCKEEKLQRAEMLLEKMKEQGLSPNVNTYTTLIDGHAKAGEFDRAYELMDAMEKDDLAPNTWTYNAVMNGFCKKGRLPEAYKLLKVCYRNGVFPDKFTYTILISASCKQDGDVRRAFAIFSVMLKEGIGVDMHTYTSLISLLSRLRKMGECERILSDAAKMGLNPTTQTYTCMVSGYCRDGNIEKAMKVFNEMSEYGCAPDSFTYGALIGGLCKESMLNEARTLFSEMNDKGFSPCEVTRVTIAYELCKKGESSAAMALLDRLERKLRVRTVSTLVRKLCSEQKVDVAAQFFDKLLDATKTVDRVTLAAFMTACYESNNYALVSDMSTRMTKEKLEQHLMISAHLKCLQQKGVSLTRGVDEAYRRPHLWLRLRQFFSLPMKLSSSILALLAYRGQSDTPPEFEPSIRIVELFWLQFFQILLRLRGTRGDIETGFPGLIPERRAVRVHATRPVNTNSLAFLVTVLLLFMILNSHQMSPNFLLWLVLGVFLMATTLRMYATCQQLQAQAQAHAVAASGLLGHTELRLHMPPSIALATRGRLQGLRLQLALLDREFDDLDYETLRALDSDNVPTASMTDEEINALPVHKYKVSGPQGVNSSAQQGSSSASVEKKQDLPNPQVGLKTSDDDLTCSVCLEQVTAGELIRSLPCLHQFHVNCIDPWLRQQGTCPVCKYRAGSQWSEIAQGEIDASDMV
ncbi:hypothetical protein SASPL_138990 [Salvia splendens]|uniref:RING-type domain-containing protein n=1 Tax=Salvia splendens TaxID=180675 RepID=A0A8X8ZEE5_SALSN|nr:hypothetical protein SASPL_138990 [Salvia splendens]